MIGKYERCICDPFALTADILCPIHGDLEAINRAMTEAAEDEQPRQDTAAQPPATGVAWDWTRGKAKRVSKPWLPKG